MLSVGKITPETITSFKEILKVLLQGREPSDDSRVKLVIGQSGCEGTNWPAATLLYMMELLIIKGPRVKS